MGSRVPGRHLALHDLASFLGIWSFCRAVAGLNDLEQFGRLPGPPPQPQLGGVSVGLAKCQVSGGMSVLQLAPEHRFDLMGGIRARFQGPDVILAHGKGLSADR